ncbi:MAG: NAD-dependent malic enzyme [Thermoleophilia bacterium]|nr:NAD-dependent malic enzyme [Gaiellaceae bacterium]MDW8339306.1 NAD-dependent malic enzyme [Thermoleophilia bacterium]
MAHLSPSFSATLRIRLDDSPGTFARVAQAIGDVGGSLGAIDIVRIERTTKVRDVTVSASDEAHLQAIVEAVRDVEGVEVLRVSDRTFLMHLGGKIEVVGKVPLKTRDDLSMAYTPGVARIAEAIADDPAAAWNLTIKRNTVAVVSDGTAVLGLGDVGPEAAMPVMEGKALLFKEFAGVDAWPLCLRTKDVDEIVRVCTAIAPGFGGINLEDISAPRCLEIEARLRAELDIPVFHDDQHGTAIVVLAALLNALRVVGKRLEEVRIVTTGVGAAGIATTEILLRAGARWIVGCDHEGAVYRGRPGLPPHKAAYAERTNPENVRGTADELLAGADVFIGLSAPGAVTREGIARMAERPIVFAMANPTPEVAPEEIANLAAVVATGRSDYPNQINNVLAFPGVFRGALDVRASAITPEMELAAAHALAAVIAEDELGPEYIVPSVFNRDVAPAVAAAVAEAAEEAGVARRPRTHE